MACMNVNNTQAKNRKLEPKRILVKIAPDMTLEQLEQIVNVAVETGCSGIVATNTTVSRSSELSNDAALQEQGGLSGKPVKEQSTEFIKHIYKFTNGSLPIIGVGGIMSADDAWEKIIAGASLIQAYMGSLDSQEPPTQLEFFKFKHSCHHKL